MKPEQWGEHIPGQEEFDLGTDILVRYPLVEAVELSWSLPPFGGRRRKCPKCRGESVALKFETAGHVTVGKPCHSLLLGADPELRAQVPFPEHMDRTCTSCGCSWVESAASDDDDDEPADE